MTLAPAPVSADPVAAQTEARLDFLDGARAFALLLGVFFHGSLSFAPFFLGWAVQDVSTGAWVPPFLLVSHSFRMALFFFIAGYFSERRIQRRGWRGFLRSRAIQLGVPFVFGWFLLRPLLVAGWVLGAASMRGEVSVRAAFRDGFSSLKTLPEGLFTGTHLWFLYYLLLTTAAYLIIRCALRSANVSSQVHRISEIVRTWLASSPLSAGVLVLPVAGSLSFMHGWGMDTPDRSLWPHFPAWTVLAVFFAVGVLFGRDPSRLGAFIKLSWFRTLLLVVSIVAAWRLSAFQAEPGNRHAHLWRIAFDFAYACMMWQLVLFTLGLFQRVMQRPNAVARTLADASYWIYLCHLPLIIWLQVAVAEMQLPGIAKLLGITVTTVAICLVTYLTLVRGMFIGALLRGQWPTWPAKAR